jgi:hypothetical protein
VDEDTQAPESTQSPARTRILLVMAVLLLSAGLSAVAVFLIAGSGTDNDAAAQAPAPLATRTPPELDESPSLAGAFVRPHPGLDGVYRNTDDRDHLREGVTMAVCTAAQLTAGEVSLCYNSNPPTSGLHWGAAAPWGVLATPAAKETLVHNMEHGGVVVWYNTANTALIAELASVVSAAVAEGKFVVMSRYEGMEPETIALTAWSRLDKFPARDFTALRVHYFIRDHSRRFNPEGF